MNKDLQINITLIMVDNKSEIVMKIYRLSRQLYCIQNMSGVSWDKT